MWLLLSLSTAFNDVSAFSLDGQEWRRFTTGAGPTSLHHLRQTEPTYQPINYISVQRGRSVCKLSESSLLSTDEEIFDEEFINTDLFDEEEGDEVESSSVEEVINGTSEGLMVTKVYRVPLEGFQKENNGREEGNSNHEHLPSLSSIFSPEDVARLKLDPQNITLPAALMLLDPEQYPTQSRARKVIRQRSICVNRFNSNHNQTINSHLEFNELGKVIARVYPGDAIGFQRRVGSDYYAMQGVPYRAPPFDVPVLYEDDHMAIVNKPGGIVVYRSEGYARGSGARRGGGHGRDTLLSALPYVLKPSNFKSSSSTDNEDEIENYPLKRPQPVHRLDRPTSGLLVVAKTKSAAVHLSQQFEYRKARKTYTAIVNGIPVPSENEQSPSSEWNMINYDLEGKTAITQWRVLRTVKSLHGRDGQLTLVELKPKTGRYVSCHVNYFHIIAAPSFFNI